MGGGLVGQDQSSSVTRSTFAPAVPYAIVVTPTMKNARTSMPMAMSVLWKSCMLNWMSR
jgi:hypothetical protein